MSTNNGPASTQNPSDEALRPVRYDPSGTIARLMDEGRKHNSQVITMCGELGCGKGFAVKAHILRVFEEAAEKGLDPLRLFPARGQSEDALRALIPEFKVTDIARHASLAALIHEASA